LKDALYTMKKFELSLLNSSQTVNH